MNAWLNVIGIGADGLQGLSPAARALVETAEVLVGGERHLAMMPVGGAERLIWELPLDRSLDAIKARRGKRVTVLATGDPMCFGIGATLARHFSAGEIAVIPTLSAFTLACARLNWPFEAVETLTLHGRPLEHLNLLLYPGARLLLLAENGATPARVAELLRARGFGPSPMIVLEELGGAKESRVEGTAESWDAPRCKDLNTIAVACRAGPKAVIHSRVPGLADQAFEHDGQITRREARAVTLSALAPLPGALLWDVGAGCGSVAIEWLRAALRASAVAIERKPERAATMARNATALGVPHLEIIAGEAPFVLEGLNTPDAVFIGGGLTAPGLFEACWNALGTGGRLVANAVTVEGEALLSRHGKALGGTLTRIAVSRLEPLGAFSAFRPSMPVTQLVIVKS
ncbi:MAG: precorrin-6y C5,15-methyltransferase (decarboxylating) subunit CbiE [Alphaproteobacteria bacterium]